MEGYELVGITIHNLPSVLTETVVLMCGGCGAEIEQTIGHLPMECVQVTDNKVVIDFVGSVRCAKCSPPDGMLTIVDRPKEEGQ
jgi:hypothetical protein